MSFSNFDDLSPGGLTIAVDDSTNFWSSIIVGPNGTPDTGQVQNALITNLTIGNNGKIQAGTSGSDRIEITPDYIRGISDSLGTTFDLPSDGSAPTFSSGTIKEVEFQAYTSGVIKTDSDPATNGGLIINNTELKAYNTSGTQLLGFVYSGTNQGDAYIGDYDNTNPGIKYDHSEGQLLIRVDDEHGIRVAEGGDIYLQASDTNPGSLIFEPCADSGHGAQLHYNAGD